MIVEGPKLRAKRRLKKLFQNLTYKCYSSPRPYVNYLNSDILREGKGAKLYTWLKSSLLLPLFLKAGCPQPQNFGYKTPFLRNFPSSPVAKTPLYHCQGSRFNPW